MNHLLVFIWPGCDSIYLLQMENLLLVFHLCVSFPFSKVFYINISHNIFLGETPFHPRRSGGTQEENGDWGGSKEEGRYCQPYWVICEDGQKGFAMRDGDLDHQQANSTITL